jgi:hypothetical protein
MEKHETRRKIIRQWTSLPKDKRQRAEQAAEFAKKAIEQNELQPSRRDPCQRVMGWLLPRPAGDVSAEAHAFVRGFAARSYSPRANPQGAFLRVEMVLIGVHNERTQVRPLN